MSRTQALLIVGHGSHLSADSSAPVYAHAARVRRTRLFEEVQEAFWKEEPPLRDALVMLESDDVYVVPLFLAEGYFTRRVVPRELGLTGPVTRFGDRTVRYCTAVGAHPSMSEMVLRRAVRDSGLGPAERAGAALVIIGHGTERSGTSGDTVRAIAADLAPRSGFATVDYGFLDQEPGIDDVVKALPQSRIVLVPFFIAEGWHTRTTIPADLGLSGDLTRVGDRTLSYTPPVGTLPDVAEVIIASAASAGARTTPLAGV